MRHAAGVQKGQPANNIKMYKLRNSLKERQFDANYLNPQMIIEKCKITTKNDLFNTS